MLRFKPNFASDEYREKLQEALEKALDSDEVKPLVAIARELRCSSNSLRKYFPDLCQAVTRRFRNRIDHNRIQYRLQEVLASSEPVPSVTELARQMGYDRTTIQAAFPALCKEVSARHFAEQNIQHKNRIITTCEKVRHAVVILHQQGVYPSVKKVTKQLGNSHVLREIEMQETYRDMLGQLGY